MEQALLADGRLGGYNRVFVMGFDRLARQILVATRIQSMPVLSEFGKQMILRRLLQEHRERLKIFGRAATRSGFIMQLSGMIRELRQYQKSPDQLRNQRQKLLEIDDPSLGPLVDKLDDLALIYQSYEEFIGDRFYRFRRISRSYEQAMFPSRFSA